MTTAALYARISLDKLKLEKGVTRQLEDVRALAQARGWEVYGEYIDNDVSAHSGAYREDYERLMADAEGKRFDQIVVWQSSRLWRSRPERAAAINRLGRLRIGIAAVQGPELDLTTAGGRMIAGVLGEFDSMESEVKGERVARAALQRAEDGQPHGPTAYGWTAQYWLDDVGHKHRLRNVENPEEAAIVREIVDRLLAGASLRGLVDDLNARQVPTPMKSEQWRGVMVRHLAMRPANVGLRVHQRKVIGSGNWPGIVDRDKHDRVVALLTAPERRQKRDGARKYLLTYGLGVCGVCGGPLASKSIPFNNGKAGREGRHLVYRCENRDCVARDLEKVDALVAAVVIERLSRPDAAEIFDGDDSAAQEARERVEGVRARLNTAADQFAAGDIDGEQLRRITARLRPELEVADAEVRRYRPPAIPREVEDLRTPDAAAVWEPLPVTAKRAVLQVLGLQVVIQPRKKTGPGFDPNEIEFRWRER